MLWDHAQVKPDDYHGNRTDIVVFQTTTRVDVAEGIALHNTDFGQGGINQIFVPDFIGATHRGEIFPVDVHGNPIPFRVEVNTSTGDLSAHWSTPRDLNTWFTCTDWHFDAAARIPGRSDDRPTRVAGSWERSQLLDGPVWVDTHFGLGDDGRERVRAFFAPPDVDASAAPFEGARAGFPVDSAPLCPARG